MDPSFTLELIGNGCEAYGSDYQKLVLEVSDNYPFSVPWTDPGLRLLTNRKNVSGYTFGILNKSRPKFHQNLLPRPQLDETTDPIGTNPQLEVHYDFEPFGFWIVRKDSEEIIFDTRTFNPRVKPLIFEKGYLQITSALPQEANIYGLGEVLASSGFRRDPNNVTQAMWACDSGGTPVNQNLYGSHPVYLEHRIRNDKGLSHVVYLANMMGKYIFKYD